MKPEKAGTPEHRQHYADLARKAALDLARVLGTGEIDGECYRGLPVGDRRVQETLSNFLDSTERGALDLFDRSVAARDLPAAHNVVTMKRRSA